MRNTCFRRVVLQLKPITNCPGQVWRFTGESQFSTLPFFWVVSGWLLAATLPSSASIPSPLSHMPKLNQHAAPSLGLRGMVALLTNVIWENHLWGSQVRQPQDKEHSRSCDWTKPGLFLSAQSAALSGLGGYSRCRNAVWYRSMEAAEASPSEQGTPREGLRTGKRHLHAEKWLFFSSNTTLPQWDWGRRAVALDCSLLAALPY